MKAVVAPPNEAAAPAVVDPIRPAVTLRTPAAERPYPPPKSQANKTKAMCARIYNSLANFEADGVRLLHSHSFIGQRQREEGRDSSAYVHESFARTYFIPPEQIKIS